MKEHLMLNKCARWIWAETEENNQYVEFRCEFFGEARIRNIPEMNYTFDSPDIPHLEEKLHQHLIPRLQEIRQRAENED